MSTSKKVRNTKFTKSIKDPSRDQFQFSTGFQFELLKYMIQDSESILVLHKIKSSYFTLLEHSLIAEVIQRAFKKYSKIPGKIVLAEFAQKMLNSSEFVNLATQEDLDIIGKTLDILYDQSLADPDIIRTSLKQFIAYIEMRDMTSNADFTDFSAIREFHRKVANVIRDVESNTENTEQSHFMVSDVTRRQLQRKIDPDVVPTPFHQINQLTNAGGYEKGSVIVLLDKAKAKKTFTMINIARGYLTMKKNVLYIDTENGAKQIMGRMTQSTLNKTKLDMISGEFDDLERKHMRKYKRLGVEFIVRKVPALLADSNTIRSIIREVETEKGIKINIIIVDYVGKMASTSRDRDDFERISNAYVDIQNLAHEEKIDAIWSAHHITREGSKHLHTRYEENDISGSIAVIRNAEAVWGLNQTPDEMENNIQRMEVVVQRDGKPRGRALFNLDVERQRMKEFTKDQRKAYDNTQGIIVDNLIDGAVGKNKTKPTPPNINDKKASNKSGDI